MKNSITELNSLDIRNISGGYSNGYELGEIVIPILIGCGVVCGAVVVAVLSEAAYTSINTRADRSNSAQDKRIALFSALTLSVAAIAVFAPKAYSKLNKAYYTDGSDV